MLENCKKISKVWRSLHTTGAGTRAPSTCFDGLEEFVCYLYGMTKSKGINKLRLKILKFKVDWEARF